MERIGLCGLYIIIHLVCPPLGSRWRFCLPEHCALSVTDEDIKTANKGAYFMCYFYEVERTCQVYSIWL